MSEQNKFVAGLKTLATTYKEEMEKLPFEERQDVFLDSLEILNGVAGCILGPRLSQTHRSITAGLFLQDTQKNVEQPIDDSTKDSSAGDAERGEGNTGGNKEPTATNQD